MTLGRTESGAIKIKTDTAGGGLRAVECACCGGRGCQITEQQFNAVLNGGTANLAGGLLLNSLVKNFTFSQTYSFTYESNGKNITFAEVRGNGVHAEVIRSVTCEARFPWGGEETYPIQMDFKRMEAAIANILLYSEVPVTPDPLNPPIYTLNAALAMSIREDHYECDPDNPFFPRFNTVFQSCALCGEVLYSWLMEAGPGETTCLQS